jgi:hypothetical protein
LLAAPDAVADGDAGPAEGTGLPAESSAMVAPVDGGEPPKPADDPLTAWDLRLAEFRIDDMAVGFEDSALRSPASVDVRDIALQVAGINNQAGEMFPFAASLALGSGGAVRADGRAGALPQPAVEADVEVRGLALGLAQPYLAEIAQVALTEGALDADVKLGITADESLGAAGQLSIAGLEISDTVKDERLVGWRDLDVDRFEFSQTGNSLEVSEVKLSGPYVRLLIDQDGTTNFQELAVDAPPAESLAPPAGEPPPALAISVGRIAIDDGSSDFTDLSLPIPFGTKIADLEGQIATLATTSTEPADVDFEGRVGEFGLARIEGVVSPAAPAGRTDVRVLFRNVELPDLSPYTVKFAGRKIDEGRLDLNLEYLIEEGKLQGANSVVIDKLRLGEKVDYPDAVDLPLGLAVALLTGPDGTIDLDLPVTGDVNDPAFSIGAVVFKVFANLITKAATAPFKLLGALVGVESEDFDRIEFTPGRADVEPPEQEKLLKLAEALGQRPELGLRIGGVVDPEADAGALRESRVDAAVAAGIEAEGDSGEEMLLERRRSVLQDLFARRFPGESADAVAAGFMVPADPGKPDGKQVLDEPAYLAALRERLVAAEAISAEDLDALARARAQAVIDVLVAGAQVDPSRISAGDPGEAKLTDDGWIPMKLEAAGLGGG